MGRHVHRLAVERTAARALPDQCAALSLPWRTRRPRGCCPSGLASDRPRSKFETGRTSAKPAIRMRSGGEQQMPRSKDRIATRLAWKSDWRAPCLGSSPPKTSRRPMKGQVTHSQTTFAAMSGATIARTALFRGDRHRGQSRTRSADTPGQSVKAWMRRDFFHQIGFTADIGAPGRNGGRTSCRLRPFGFQNRAVEIRPGTVGTGHPRRQRRRHPVIAQLDTALPVGHGSRGGGTGLLILNAQNSWIRRAATSRPIRQIPDQPPRSNVTRVGFHLQLAAVVADGDRIEQRDLQKHLGGVFGDSWIQGPPSHQRALRRCRHSPITFHFTVELFEVFLDSALLKSSPAGAHGRMVRVLCEPGRIEQHGAGAQIERQT